MRKSIIFLLVLCAFLTSCSKEEQRSTYTVKSSLQSYSSFTTDVTAFEYNSAGEKIANHSLLDAYNGHSEQFTASELAVKIKIYILMSSSSTSVGMWVQQVYYLTSGGNINININGQTIAGPSEP
jgi:uncharacterized lipoprotein YajG